MFGALILVHIIVNTTAGADILSIPVALVIILMGMRVILNLNPKRILKKSFRIQKNGNNIRVSNKRIRLAKIRFCPLSN